MVLLWVKIGQYTDFEGLYGWSEHVRPHQSDYFLFKLVGRLEFFNFEVQFSTWRFWRGLSYV